MPEENKPTNAFQENIKKEVDKIPPTSDHNLMAALSYVWVLSLVMLLIRRGDAFIQFHAKQGTVLLIISIIASILLWVPVLGFVVWALSIAGMVVGFINAWQGKESKLPFIYGWSQKIKI